MASWRDTSEQSSALTPLIVLWHAPKPGCLALGILEAAQFNPRAAARAPKPVSCAAGDVAEPFPLLFPLLCHQHSADEPAEQTRCGQMCGTSARPNRAKTTTTTTSWEKRERRRIHGCCRVQDVSDVLGLPRKGWWHSDSSSGSDIPAPRDSTRSPVTGHGVQGDWDTPKGDSMGICVPPAARESRMDAQGPFHVHMP